MTLGGDSAKTNGAESWEKASNRASEKKRRMVSGIKLEFMGGLRHMFNESSEAVNLSVTVR